jgi:hypothetical protein
VSLASDAAAPHAWINDMSPIYHQLAIAHLCLLSEFLYELLGKPVWQERGRVRCKEQRMIKDPVTGH